MYECMYVNMYVRVCVYYVFTYVYVCIAVKGIVGDAVLYIHSAN